MTPVNKYTAISNMPIKSIYHSLSATTGQPLQDIEFHSTPPMSTYLVALVIGQYDCLEDITPSQCKVRAYVQGSRQHSSSVLTCEQIIPSVSDEIRDSLSGAPPTVNSLAATQQNQANVDGSTSTQPVRNHAKFALTVAVKALDYYERLFNIKYPLPKFDLIAIRDFVSGAMENWGATIYSEVYMLCDDMTSVRNKQWVALVVAHEIAHQWFGNLVTLKDWSYLWLNEGFAEFMMFSCVDTLYPEYNVWRLFVTDIIRPAMEADMSHYIHPIETPVNNTRSIIDLFDQISYCKGAALIRMLYYYVGSGKFDISLRHYLAKYAYTNTDSEDLWRSFKESSNHSTNDYISSMMYNWTKLPGYPLLRVKISTQTQSSFRLNKQLIIKQEVSIEQEKFDVSFPSQVAEPIFFDITNATFVGKLSNKDSYRGSSKNNNNNNSSAMINSKNKASVWMIPITLLARSRGLDKVQHVLINGRNKTVIVTGSTNNFNNNTQQPLNADVSIGWWIKLNHNSIGYYRVDYVNSANWLALGEAVKRKELSVIDRLNLQEDLYSLVKYGKRRTVDYLEYLKRYYIDEEEYMIWSSIFDSLRGIRLLVSNHQYTDDGQVGEESTANLEIYNTYMQSFLRKTRMYKSIMSSTSEEDFWLVHPTKASQSTTIKNDFVDQKQQLKIQLVKHLIQFDDEQLKSRARLFFHRQANHQTQPVDANLKASIYRALLSDSEDDGLHQWFWDRYNHGDTTSYERSSISTALALNKNKTRQDDMIIRGIIQNQLRPQDAQLVIQTLATSQNGRKLLLQHLISHFELIREKGFLTIWLKSLSYGSDHSQLLAQLFPSQDKLEALKSMLNQDLAMQDDRPINPEKPAVLSNSGNHQSGLLYQSTVNYVKILDSTERSALNSALENIELNKKWLKRDGAQLLEYMRTQTQRDKERE